MHSLENIQLDRLNLILTRHMVSVFNPRNTTMSETAHTSKDARVIILHETSIILERICVNQINGTLMALSRF